MIVQTIVRMHLLYIGCLLATEASAQEDLHDLLNNFKRGIELYEMTQPRFDTLFDAYKHPGTTPPTKRSIAQILADRDYIVDKMLANVLRNSRDQSIDQAVYRLLRHKDFHPDKRYWPLIEVKNRIRYYLDRRAGGVDRAIRALDAIHKFYPRQSLFTDIVVESLGRDDLRQLQVRALRIIASDIKDRQADSRYATPEVFSLLWSMRDHSAYFIRSTSLWLVDAMLGYMDLQAQQARQVAREFLTTIVLKIRNLQRAERSGEAADLVSRLFPESDPDRFYHYGREERGSVIRTLIRFAEGDHDKLQGEALKELLHVLASGYDVTIHGIARSKITEMLIEAHNDGNKTTTEAIKSVLNIYELDIEALRGNWFAQLCWRVKSRIFRVPMLLPR